MNSTHIPELLRPRVLNPSWLFTLFVLAFTSSANANDYLYTTNFPDTNTVTISSYIGFGGAVDIPFEIEGKTVTGIGTFSFADRTSVISVTIPNSVTNILGNAFYLCTNLTSVTIPGSVITIGNNAFDHCTHLYNVSIGYGVAIIGSNAFLSCNSLGSITIPGSIATIGDGLFANLFNLTSVTIGDGVTQIGSDAFLNTGLIAITIPGSVTSIGNGAFESCINLTSATIGNGIAFISDHAFAFCSSLTNVTIGPNVVNIGDRAFQGCASLNRVTIPGTVTNIGILSFADCNTLKGIYFRGDAPSASSSVVFQSINATVYYLPGASGWPTIPDFWPNPAAGRPTAWWRPEAQSDDYFGVLGDEFGFNVSWASGQVVVVETCMDLTTTNWVPVATNSFTSDSSYFSDPQWAINPKSYYRLRAQ